MTPGFIGAPEEGAGGGGGDEGGGPVTGDDPVMRLKNSKERVSVILLNLNQNSHKQNHLECFIPHSFGIQRVSFTGHVSM